VLSPVPSLGRRRVLAGGALGVAGITLTGLAGCEAGGPADPDATGDPVEATDPAVDADGDLSASVATDLAEAAAYAGATAAAFSGLAPLADGFRRLHEAHARMLGGSPQVPSPSAPTGPRSRARAELLTAEEGLQQRLSHAAVQAGSGALAQTFASMAAAVAQRRADAGE
jgi:hypothetical protein